jgi:hypothetical protein
MSIDHWEEARRGMALHNSGRPAPTKIAPSRDELGSIVREIWTDHVRETDPHPPPHHLSPFDELLEPDKEVDRRIGERPWAMGLASAALASRQAFGGLSQTVQTQREEILALSATIAILQDELAAAQARAARSSKPLPSLTAMDIEALVYMQTHRDQLTIALAEEDVWDPDATPTWSDRVGPAYFSSATKRRLTALWRAGAIAPTPTDPSWEGAHSDLEMEVSISPHVIQGDKRVRDALNRAREEAEECQGQSLSTDS